MTHRFGRTLTGIVLLALLAACGSTPKSNHYILRAREVPPAAEGGIAIGVGPVSVPEYLQRSALARSAGGNRVDLEAQERWAEPLESGIARVLALNLAGLLQTQDVRAYPWHPARQPDYALRLRVLELDASADTATLVAEWAVVRPAEDDAVRRSIAHLSAPLATGDAEAVAAAYSDLFYQLSEQAAAAIREAQSHSSPAED